MFEIIESDLFSNWVTNLKDSIGRSKIRARVVRFQAGHFGDVETIGDGILEAKIKGHGPGHRFYYAREGMQVILLLCGGDKSSQAKDISLAKELWKRRQP
jgi:putative addiction module killer protein